MPSPHGLVRSSWRRGADRGAGWAKFCRLHFYPPRRLHMAAINNDFASAGFSVKTAYYLANVAQAAYLSDLAGVEIDLGFDRPTAVLAAEEYFGFVAQVAGHLVLAFRGTDNIQNW